MGIAATAELADRAARHERLRLVADRVRPVVLAREQTLPVLDSLAPLLPQGGLRRGITVGVAGAAASSLTLSLVAGPAAAGSWVVVVGMPWLGLAALVEHGVPLERVAVIRPPEPGEWAPVVAALLGAVDLVVVAPTHQVRLGDARRLTARARERGTVLVHAASAQQRVSPWPEAPDLVLRTQAGAWRGLGAGHGVLVERPVVVEATGRRDHARPRRAELVLPATVERAARHDALEAAFEVATFEGAPRELAAAHSA